MDFSQEYLISVNSLSLTKWDGGPTRDWHDGRIFYWGVGGGGDGDILTRFGGAYIMKVSECAPPVISMCDYK